MGDYLFVVWDAFLVLVMIALVLVVFDVHPWAYNFRADLRKSLETLKGAWNTILRAKIVLGWREAKVSDILKFVAAQGIASSWLSITVYFADRNYDAQYNGQMPVIPDLVLRGMGVASFASGLLLIYVLARTAIPAKETE